MDSLIERFLKKIKVKDLKPFEECFFDKLATEKNANRIIATIHAPTVLPYKAYVELFQRIQEIAEAPEGFETQLSFIYSDEFKGMNSFLTSYGEGNGDFEIFPYLSNYNYDVSSKTVIFTYPKNNYDDDYEEDTESTARNTATVLRTFLRDINSSLKVATREQIDLNFEENKTDAIPSDADNKEDFSNEGESAFMDDEDRDDAPAYIPPKIHYDARPKNEDYEDEDEDPMEAQLESFDAERQKRYKEMAIKAHKANLLRQEQEKQRIKDENTAYPAKLKDIDNLKRVIVQGKIFKVDQRETKKGRLITTIEYSDGSDAIPSVLFEGKKFDRPFMSQLKVGTNIKVRGEVRTDDFSHQLIIKPDSIKILEPDKPREDPSKDKRVELHLHTVMSAMDGLTTITDYAKMAKQFGMKAIGITDHGVVQSFPEAQKAEKSLGIKMLYGCEIYMVDSHLDICINTKDIRLNDADYVIFDLETTGLSARYDRIIEFGATKYTHGQEYDKRDFFINPNRKLRDLIMKKTNITQEMVDGGKPIKEALQEILDYFGDAVIIDHNAGFDIGFLNEALKNNGLPQIKNSIIDTLPWSRYMFPKQRSHTLEAVARTLGIEYDETKVHRAIYDAEVLEAVYMAMLSKVSETNPDINMKDLANLTSKDVIQNARPKHIIAYAKNAEGLKDLYKIVSLSSTDYLSDVPKTPRFLIEENRKNLLIGSACFNGEVFDCALTKSEDVLMDVLSWYDYIEVQPPACYSWLINDGQISSQENLLMILKDLISAAKKAKKDVVATGDCHYLNKEDKIYRDVYIFAKGLKGVQHPLNPYRRKSQKPYENPDQYFLSTQEMKDAFFFLEDEKLIDEIVVQNTNKIADMIEPLKPTKDKLYPPYIKDCDKNLINLVYETAKKTYGDPLPELIKTRLETELKGIGSNGYYVIYWIASVLVRQVNAAGHLVGSRGSVGSSLVATMSGITEVNPLPPHWLCEKCKHLEWADLNTADDGFDLPDKDCPQCHVKMHKDGHNIPFETFLGFHADKVPDIDLNFPSDFQAQAHEMTRKLLGAGNVYKAGTIQTTEEKNAIGYVKGYFENRNIDPKTIRPAQIDRLAMGCIGVKRTTGQHPGGIIVIPSNMSVFDFTPYQYPANSEEADWRTTHYDFHAIHDNVLKFDELGHVDPYAIKMMCDMAGVDWQKIPFDDAEAMSIFWSPKALKLKRNVLNQKTGALGLPEFGTALARRILEETKPRSYGDLVRISGLSHGTNVFQGNAEDLINSGKATLRDVIGCRDDIMTQLHQRWGIPSDQAFTIMEYVRHGFYPAGVKPEKGSEYIQLMRQHGVSETYIDSCKKIAYLFPKGHAVAYVMMAVRVAWFKVHKPEYYYATYLTLRCDAYDLKVMQGGQKAALRWLHNYDEKKMNHLHLENKENSLVNTMNTIVEMTDRGFNLAKINVMKSAATMFTVDPKTHDIIPPFSAMDSLGETLATKIVSEREKKPFNSIEDFVQRGKVPSAIVAALKELGAFGDLPDSAQMNLFEFM